MKNIIKNLKENENLSSNELESLLDSHFDVREVVLLILKHPNSNQAIQESCYSHLLGEEIDASLNSLLALESATNQNKQELEKDVDFEIEMSEELKKEAQAVFSLDTSLLLPVKGKRVKGNLFLLESSPLSEKLSIKDSNLSKKNKSGFVQGAVLSTLIALSVSFGANTAKANEGMPGNDFTEIMDLSDNSTDDLNFFSSHFKFDEEARLLKQMSALLGVSVEEFHNLNDDSGLYSKVKALKKGEDSKVKDLLADLKQVYETRVSLMKFSGDKLTSLKKEIKKLTAESKKGSASAEEKLKKLTNHSHFKQMLPFIMNEDFSDYNLRTVKNFNKFLKQTTGMRK